MGAIVKLGKSGLTYHRSPADSLDLVIHDGVFKNFSLDNLGRLQYNSSMWRQRARINVFDGQYYSVPPYGTLYSSSVKDLIHTYGSELYEVTFRIGYADPEFWIYLPVGLLPNTNNHQILAIHMKGHSYECYTPDYDAFMSRYSASTSLPYDGPDLSNYVGDILVPMREPYSIATGTIIEDIRRVMGIDNLAMGVTYDEDSVSYLLHFLYLGDYRPPECRYTTSDKVEIVFGSNHYTTEAADRSLYLFNNVRGKIGSHTKISLYNNEIHYNDEVITGTKISLLKTDLVDYDYGDRSILSSLPEGFVVEFYDRYDKKDMHDHIYSWFSDIWNAEYFLRCIMIDEVIDCTPQDILDFYDYADQLVLDNMPYTSFVVLFPDQSQVDALHESDIALGSDLYDSLGRLAISPIDAFYSVVRALDAVTIYDNYIVKHNRPGIKIVSLLSPEDTESVTPGDKFCYRSDQLDSFLFNLYINTFHACINKHREEIIGSDDKVSTVREALKFYNAPEAYDYVMTQVGDEIHIECKVNYKQKTGIINININTIING